MLAPKCKICLHNHWASEPHTLRKSVTPLKVAQAAVSSTMAQAVRKAVAGKSAHTAVVDDPHRPPKAKPKAKPKKKAAKR